MVQPQSQPVHSAASARPRLPGSLRRAWSALLICAVLATPNAHAGRTDSDWMAPPQPELLNDAPGGLERLGVGQPAQSPAGGLTATRAAMVADMRIATHEEAQALLQGSVLPGGADSGAATGTLSTLLDRLGASLPSSAVLTPKMQGAGADLDCALFAEGVRVRRLLGSKEARRPGDTAGPESAMELDVPIRCIARFPRVVSSAPERPTAQPISDQGTKATDTSYWELLADWTGVDSAWWMALAGSAATLAVFGLVAQLRRHGMFGRSARGGWRDRVWR